jgi:uncharacterized protein YjiS (DUF1127 family)
MAHTLHNNSSVASVFAYKVVTFFERLGAALAKRKEARQTFKTLHALTDRELSDIGISRGDIRSISNDTWEDNRRRDLTPYGKPVSVNPNLRGSV